MPKEHTITSYEFDELSSKAKEKARDWFREGTLDYEWWDSTYEDAASIGLKINEFDVNRNYITADLRIDATDSARKVIADHGKETSTYKAAASFLKDIEKAKTTEQEDEAADEYWSELKKAYLKMLSDEAEYLTSDESVDEMIKANEYEFHKDGSRFVVR